MRSHWNENGVAYNFPKRGEKIKKLCVTSYDLKFPGGAEASVGRIGDVPVSQWVVCLNGVKVWQELHSTCEEAMIAAEEIMIANAQYVIETLGGRK